MANDPAAGGLTPGKKVPDFSLEGAEGRVTLAKLRGAPPGKYVVVYFYPKDKTPGCTREGQAFSLAMPAFAKAGAVVVGVSKDTVTMHASFASSCGIKVPLLSDADLHVHKAFGAYGEKTMYGKKVLGTIRSTFIIAPDGTLARAFRSVKVDGHADAVLAAIVSHRNGDAEGGLSAPTGRPAKKAAKKTAKAARKPTAAKTSAR
jgi:peroxiredoxin Q/BCP